MSLIRRIWLAKAAVWRRFNEWVRDYPLPAYIALVIAVAFSFWQVQVATEAATDERDARIKVGAEVQHYICAQNNRQDRILADLVESSLQGGGGNFGDGLDPTILTDFDLRVLGVIAKVQTATEQGGSGYRLIFKRALAELRSEAPCGRLVKLFEDASNSEDYREVRRVLLAQEALEKRRGSRAVEEGSDGRSARGR